MALLREAEADWLASDPIFYNEKTCKISRNMLEVIDYDHFEFDAEGLNDYLKFGYSVLGQTMVKNVKFLLPNTRIQIVSGKLIIEDKGDPVDKRLGKREEKGEDVIELILRKTREWADKQESIVLPLSGGHDSRILSCALKNNEKVRAYTYGISEKQEDSFEVYNAREIAKINNINWSQIQLGQFHREFDYFYQLYGPSINLGGSYHVEFYKNILCNAAPLSSVLSGILGDTLAGIVKQPQISSARELYKLAYAHEIQVTQNVCKLSDPGENKEKFFSVNRDKFADEKWKDVFLIRFQSIFLSYLCRVPNSMGFNTWAPYLDFDIAMAMLNIPQTERIGRKWQVDYFKKHNLYVEDGSNKKKIDRSNTLNLHAQRQCPLPALNQKILGMVINESFIEWINREMGKLPIIYLPWYKGNLGAYINPFVHLWNRNKRMAYNYYIVLKPIEYLLKKVNGVS